MARRAAAAGGAREAERRDDDLRDCRPPRTRGARRRARRNSFRRRAAGGTISRSATCSPPPPSLPYKVDTSCPSLRTDWTRLVLYRFDIPSPTLERASPVRRQGSSEASSVRRQGSSEEPHSRGRTPECAPERRTATPEQPGLLVLGSDAPRGLMAAAPDAGELCDYPAPPPAAVPELRALAGPGIVFGFDAEGGGARVRSLLPGSAAARSGALRPGDLILAIDGAATRGMPPAAVSQRLLGTEGSSVSLEVAPRAGGDPLVVRLPRLSARAVGPAPQSSPAPPALPRAFMAPPPR